MKILVLGGGTSPEREISLLASKNVEDGLKKAGFEVAFYDTKNPLKGLLDLAKKVDAVFPIILGIGGEDGTIQTELDKHNIKYLGSKPESLRVTLDKIHFKEICNQNAIKTPRGEKIDLKRFHQSELIKHAFVLKPIRGGSAIDTFIVRKPLNDFYSIDQALQKYGEMLLEELIEGQEITVGILGNKALPVVEIIPPEGEEFDFKNRYNGKTQEICPPKTLSKELQQKAQEVALKVHQITGSRHFSRIDMMVKGSEIYVLELNSLPGLTKQSLFPREAFAIGLSFENLMREFVKLTMRG